MAALDARLGSLCFTELGASARGKTSSLKPKNGQSKPGWNEGAVCKGEITLTLSAPEGIDISEEVWKSVLDDHKLRYCSETVYFV